jgi:hypothetical protein
MPGEEALELWVADSRGTWRQSPEDRGTPGGTMAVECLAMDSLPFWSAASPEASIETGRMAALHWEALGVDTGGEGRCWCHWRAWEEQGRTLVATMAFAGEPPPGAWEALRGRGSVNNS